MSFKRRLIGAGFAAMHATGLHHALAQPGSGLILALHRVRPFAPATPGYAPNRLLEVTPDFFDTALAHIAARGFEFVDLAEAARRVEHGGAPFAVLTFDDGYRDTRDFALPILEKHNAPASVFFCIGFLERTARLWWLELEEAIRRLDRIEMPGIALSSRTPAEKSAAFERAYWTLRARPEAVLLDEVARLAEKAGVASADLAADLFMDWPEAVAFACHPLITVGAHSLSHRRLAHWTEDDVRVELAGSKTMLETKLGCAVTQFAYPVGDATSAGPREFELAGQAGYDIAVTTRPGLLFRDHAIARLALPRVSLNGLWQNLGYLDVLLSGAPFRVWNRGRRVNVA